MPLRRSDGTLFGTLCAIDPHPQRDDLADELPMIEGLTALLCSILEADLCAAEQTRSAERARAEALIDSMTGLCNRRGWDQLLAAEETRCRRYGHSATVTEIDLDGLKQIDDLHGHAAGDDLIQLAAQAIRCGVRQQDVVARVGGDEFLILDVECDANGAKRWRSVSLRLRREWVSRPRTARRHGVRGAI